MTFIDANVLLEVILKRRKSDACQKLLAKAEDQAISTLTLSIVMYFVEKSKLELAPIQAFLENFLWLPITEADARWAFQHYNGDDYEDALQIACAVREQCKQVVSLDKALVQKYTDTIKTVQPK